jgi:hypothetical protein
VRPASDEPPHKFETGTQNHEGIAGILGAIEYFDWLGGELAAKGTGARPASAAAGSLKARPRSAHGSG